MRGCIDAMGMAMYYCTYLAVDEQLRDPGVVGGLDGRGAMAVPHNGPTRQKHPRVLEQGGRTDQHGGALSV